LQPTGILFSHHDKIPAVAFSPDGGMVLTGSLDRSARLWDVATGKPLGPPLPHRDGVTSVAFLPKGKGLVAGCGDGTVQFWPLPTPLDGTPAQVELVIQVLTGMELDQRGAPRLLKVEEWRQRHRRLPPSGDRHRAG
jgi:WD40 repeat protein